jgi:hypothetical protein
VLRCQRWSERLDRDLRKPDDRVLDCCLYFRGGVRDGVGAADRSVGTAAVEGRVGVSMVTLWTSDRNLALLVS